MMNFKILDDTTYEGAIAETQAGIIIFHKQLCPHCKNLEKVLGKFATKQPDVAIMSVDSEANPLAMSELGVGRTPTMVFIKMGKVVHSKAGLFNPKQLLALFNSL